MLINFTIKNVKSFRNVTSFSLVSKNKIRENAFHEFNVFDRLCVVKNAGIYGANASGKTNLVKALHIAKEYILTGNILEQKIGFLDNLGEESTFSFVLEIGGTLFNYEFSLKKVNGLFLINTDEYLAQLNNDGSIFKVVYSKKENIFDYGSEKIFEIFKNGYKNVNSISFLTYMSAPERRIQNSRTSEIFLKIYDFFANKLIVINSFSNVYSIINDNNIKNISSVLKEYDTGLVDSKFVKVDSENIYRYLPAPIAKDIIEQLLRIPQKSISIGYEQELLLLSKGDNGEIILKRLNTKHSNIASEFCFGDESNGTKRLFYLIGMLLSGKMNDKVIVIDEIEKGSHPNLISKLIGDFQKINKDTNAQLIYTSHLASLMDSVLRKDEVYFVEKDINGCSSIYSLLDFKDRTTVVSKKYLDGRFGATPDLGVNLDATN